MANNPQVGSKLNQRLLYVPATYSHTAAYDSEIYWKGCIEQFENCVPVRNNLR